MTAKTTDTNTNLKYKIVLEGFNKKQYESILSALNRLKKAVFLLQVLKLAVLVIVLVIYIILAI